MYKTRSDISSIIPCRLSSKAVSHVSYQWFVLYIFRDQPLLAQTTGYLKKKPLSPLTGVNMSRLFDY